MPLEFHLGFAETLLSEAATRSCMFVGILSDEQAVSHRDVFQDQFGHIYSDGIHARLPCTSRSLVRFEEIRL